MRLPSLAFAFILSWSSASFAQPETAAPASAAPETAAPEAPAPPEAPPPAAPPPERTPQIPPTPAPTAGEQPTPETTTTLDSGLRFALDFGYVRAASSAIGTLGNGSPSILPLGGDVSVRLGPKTLVGAHGWLGLASRDDCANTDCTARSYGLGVHFEATLVRSERFDLWFRYGAGYEVLYQGGFAGDGGGHLFRAAADIADVRLGGDFVLSREASGKAWRLGPYVGANVGVPFGQTGSTGSGNGASRSLDKSSADPHIWLSLGVRASFDP